MIFCTKLICWGKSSLNMATLLLACSKFCKYSAWTGRSLWNINISNGHGSFPFDVDFVFPLPYFIMSNTVGGVLYETGTPYLPCAPGFMAVFVVGVHVANLFRFLCCLSLLVRSIPCCLCLWIVHSWFPLRFSLTYI